jgi:hypothetical protein
MPMAARRSAGVLLQNSAIKGFYRRGTRRGIVSRGWDAPLARRHGRGWVGRTEGPSGAKPASCRPAGRPTASHRPATATASQPRSPRPPPRPPRPPRPLPLARPCPPRHGAAARRARVDAVGGYAGGTECGSFGGASSCGGEPGGGRRMETSCIPCGVASRAPRSARARAASSSSSAPCPKPSNPLPPAAPPPTSTRGTAPPGLSSASAAAAVAAAAAERSRSIAPPPRSGDPGARPGRRGNLGYGAVGGCQTRRRVEGRSHGGKCSPRVGSAGSSGTSSASSDETCPVSTR